MKLFYFLIGFLTLITVRAQSCDSTFTVTQRNVTKQHLDSLLLNDGLSQSQVNLFQHSRYYKLRINGGGGFSTRTEMKLCLTGSKPMLLMAKGNSDANDSARTSIGKDSNFVNLRGFNNKGWVNVTNGADSTTLFLELDSKWGSNIDTDINIWLNATSALTSISYSLLDNNNDDFGYATLESYSLPVCDSMECSNYRLTCIEYPENSMIEDSLQKEISPLFSLADWDNLKKHPDINGWLKCMGIEEDETFLISKGGSRIYSGNRHYYVHYSSDGKPYSSFLAHDQKAGLYLGSWNNFI